MEVSASPTRDPERKARQSRRRLATGLVAVVVASTGWWVASQAQEGEQWLPSQPLVEGRRVFEEKHCSSCHGVPGDPNAERIGPDLGRQRAWQDVMQLAGSFWNHTPAMLERMRERGIERPTLSSDDMRKLAAYLFYLNFLDEPGDVGRGRALFEERSCTRCHQLGGHGGTAGPRLDELKPYASSLFLAQALWNHGIEMSGKMKELQLDRPRLEGNDVADIVAFMRADAQPAAPLQPVAAEAGSPRAGRMLFQQKRCIECHAIAGSGGTIGPDLGLRRPMRHVSEVAGALWNHGPIMWAKMKDRHIAFPYLSDRDMSDLLAYLYFVQYVGGGGDAQKGAAVFRDKHCAQCHAAAGAGPKKGPDLAASKALASPADWAAAMWNHAPAVDQALRETQAPWPRFDDDEMRDLVVFLRSGTTGK
ncbi:MAG: c-type cytochrome [Candidatus Binatia bacterium]